MHFRPGNAGIAGQGLQAADYGRCEACVNASYVWLGGEVYLPSEETGLAKHFPFSNSSLLLQLQASYFASAEACAEETFRRKQRRLIVSEGPDTTRIDSQTLAPSNSFHGFQGVGQHKHQYFGSARFSCRPWGSRRRYTQTIEIDLFFREGKVWSFVARGTQPTRHKLVLCCLGGAHRTAELVNESMASLTIQHITRTGLQRVTRSIGFREVEGSYSRGCPSNDHRQTIISLLRPGPLRAYASASMGGFSSSSRWQGLEHGEP